jgi:hypothetical protein
MGKPLFISPANARLEVKAHGRAHGNQGTRITRFFGPTGVTDPGTEAYIVEVSPGTRHRAHFHHTDQFQVFLGASDTVFQSKETGPLLVHYTDADTVYGPFGAGELPYKYVTFRRHPSTFTGFVPENKGDLSLGEKKRHYKSDLRKWLDAAHPARGEVETESFIEPQRDGLAGFTVNAGPGAQFIGPATAGTGGQYYLVLDGEVIWDDQPLPEFSLGWVSADDEPPVVIAGDNGARLMILQFGLERVAQDLPEGNLSAV